MEICHTPAGMVLRDTGHCNPLITCWWPGCADGDLCVDGLRCLSQEMVWICGTWAATVCMVASVFNKYLFLLIFYAKDMTGDNEMNC